MIPPQPQVKDLVLVGGGHAHVYVLKAFAMHPVHGLRITLISREVDTPYSGMLPGYVNGAYAASDVHINLLKLARFAGARLLVGEVTNIDPDARRLSYGDDRNLSYDLLSVNTGAAPNCPFDFPHVIPVKPIGQFLPAWHALEERLLSGSRLAVVGGGAGGFEIALTAQKQLGAGVTVSLLTSGELLPEHGPRVQALGHTAIVEAGVELHTNFRVTAVTADAVCAESGAELLAAGVLWVTGVSAPDWIRQTGLGLDDEGYIEVDRYQRSITHPEVFAAGDVAGMRDQPRPKSGVFAVRQGPVLANNLRAAALDKNGGAKPYRAQRRYLALLNCADGSAIASYGGFAARNRMLWALKQRIDKAFISKFIDLPEMSLTTEPGRADVLTSSDLGGGMRCGGCGSKINATLLKRVLKNIVSIDAPHVLNGIGDDAAVLGKPDGPLVITTDGFRSMVDDTRLLGRVAAHHALSDIYAMGAEPTAVLLNATVPLMSERMMEEELSELLCGVQSVLIEENIPLVGGHTAEGAELAVSLTVTGVLKGVEALTKTAGEPGDLLVLTQGLGSGCILAAAMRGDCATETWRGCLESLDVSNRRAAQIGRDCAARACTDVTGFGLAGHLFEMLDGNSGVVGAELNLAAIPVLNGALEVLELGIVSSLHSANAQALEIFDVSALEVSSASTTDTRVQLLADPQTSGGLLVALPAENAHRCVEELHAAGYEQAAVIGRLVTGVSRIVSAA